MEKENPAKEVQQSPTPPPETSSDSYAAGGTKDLLFLDVKAGTFTNLSKANRVTIAADRIKVYDGSFTHEIKCQNHEAAKVIFGTLVNHHLAYNLVIGHPVPNTQSVENRNESKDKTGSAVQEEKEVGTPANEENGGLTPGSTGSNSQPESIPASGETYHESSKELKLVK